MDIRRLQLLYRLAAHGTVAATAEALHLTGPAVSQQLAALEKEAGVPLLERNGRVLRLTTAGQILVDHAQVIFGAVAAAEADLMALRSGGRGTVHVAAFPSAARVLFAAVWPMLGDLRLRLTEHEPDAALEALRHGAVDLAVVHAYTLLPRTLPAGFEQHALVDDPVVLAVPVTLAGERGLTPGQPVALADFATADWLMPGADTSCHELTARACGAAGFVPQPLVLASDFAVITALVGAGAGVAMVPRMALPPSTPGVSLHSLVTPIARTISAVLPIGTAKQPALARVLELLTSSTGRASLHR